MIGLLLFYYSPKKESAELIVIVKMGAAVTMLSNWSKTLTIDLLYPVNTGSLVSYNQVTTLRWMHKIN